VIRTITLLMASSGQLKAQSIILHGNFSAAPARSSSVANTRTLSLSGLCRAIKSQWR